MKSIALSIFFLLSCASNIYAFSVGKNRVFVGTPINERRRIIQDCMTPISQLCTLTSDATVDEAVFLMLDHGISGAPVIDKESGQLLGIVSTYDFLQQEAGEGQLLPIQGTLEDVKAYLSQAKKICASQVGDLMSSEVVTMSPEHTMRDAAVLMNQHNMHRLPIVDNGRLVGMLTSSDVMKDMVKVVRKLAPSKDLSP